jgi:hypothetical protein
VALTSSEESGGEDEAHRESSKVSVDRRSRCQSRSRSWRQVRVQAAGISHRSRTTLYVSLWTTQPARHDTVSRPAARTDADPQSNLRKSDLTLTATTAYNKRKGRPIFAAVWGLVREGTGGALGRLMVSRETRSHPAARMVLELGDVRLDEKVRSSGEAF